MSVFASKHGYGTSGCAAGLKYFHTYFEILALNNSVYFLSLFHIVDPDNYIDGIHLNREGYHQIASAITGKIESANMFLLR
jgi:lysophospholipase L1-like esterase